MRQVPERLITDSELTTAVMRCVAGVAMWTYAATGGAPLPWQIHAIFAVANLYAVALLTLVVRIHRRSMPYPRPLVAVLTVFDHLLVLAMAFADDGVASMLLVVLTLVVITDAARRGVRAAVAWAAFDASAIAFYGLVIDIERGPLSERLRFVAWWAWVLIGGAILVGVIARAAFDSRQRLDDERRKVAALADAERERRAFLAVISHELRTPLASITALCGALSRHDGLTDEATRAEAASLIDSHATHLTALMEDIGRLSHGDSAHERAPRPGQVELGPLVREAASAAGVDFERLRVGTGVADVTIVSDQVKLRRILTNLLENAARHSSGLVEVEARSNADGVAISVLDRGPGISPAIADQVFDRGFSFGHERDSSGLGLWIVRELVGQLGGTAIAAPRPGGGVQVVVEIPATLSGGSPGSG